MQVRIKNNLAIVIAVLLAGLSLALILAVDYSLGQVVSNARLIKLQNQSDAQTSLIDSEVKRMKVDITSLQERLTTDGNRHYPDLRDLQGMCRYHSLTIHRVDRVDNRSFDNKRQARYRITSLGTIGSIVRFLKATDNAFVFDANQIVIQPADETGRKISLTVSLVLAE